jgi:murein tripeptide amidase MpaA
MCTAQAAQTDHLLWAGAGAPKARADTPRRVAVVCARVHPGETPASHVTHALMRTLARGGPAEAALLDAVTVVVVPMLNPDGCFIGNYRTDAGGCDLNRLWGTANPDLEPALYHVLQLLKM